MIKIHLSKLLGERRWSQAYLAKITGIRPTTINELYHELVDRVNLDHINKICEAMDCSLTDLMEYVPDEVRTTGRNLILEEHGLRKDDE